MSSQNASSPQISVIVVNYGTAELAIEAVDSVLARHHGGRQVDIHLVDNASPGDDATIIARAHADRDWADDVTLYLEKENHGFGRGNNLVLKRLARRPVAPEKVFLLNPDARLNNEALDILASFLDAHADAGCVGPRIIAPDGSPATAAFRFPSAISEFSDALAFGPIARIFKDYSVSFPLSLSTQPVHWVSGAAVMLRWSAVQEVRGFDPDFFLYFEEVDLMKRLSLRGWQVWHVAEASVCHIEGASTNLKGSTKRREKRPDYWYDSWLLYHSKNHAPWVVRLCAMNRLMGWGLNQVICLLRGRQAVAPKYYLDGFFRRVLCPLISLQPKEPVE